MSELNFDEPPFPSDDVNQTNQEAGNPELNTDPRINKTPADPILTPEAPVGNNVAAVSQPDRAATQKTHVNKNPALSVAILNREESEHLRTLWNEIQGKFVDEPRLAVQQADALVSETVEKIIQVFATEHASLEGQWNQGIDVSTEDLRKAFQHYRSFFNKLVV